MTAEWSGLRQELALWRHDGLELPLWWRDDDAVEATAELDQLADLSMELEIPVHLAVIPLLARNTLARTVRDRANLGVLVHGWAHRDHSADGEKKAEFGRLRPDAKTEITSALTRINRDFGPRALPVFVPPWNRIHVGYHEVVRDAGYRALSVFGTSVPGVNTLINTHLDPIDWRGTRGLGAPEELIDRLIGLLAARRVAGVPVEPLGYLSHHLVHDTDIWAFSRAVLSELRGGGARVLDLNGWLTAQEEMRAAAGRDGDAGG